MPHLKRIYSERSEEATRALVQKADLQQLLGEISRRHGLCMTGVRTEGPVSCHCACSASSVLDPSVLPHPTCDVLPSDRELVLRVLDPTVHVHVHVHGPSTSMSHEARDSCIFSDNCQCNLTSQL